ncbi:MAG TPA: nuclear transport factor 2 family protein [Pyrinomonadaceae bacterium]|nr:nuclear transport factor 2 family protein [Pyrinomonadaceae bacterium]
MQLIVGFILGVVASVLASFVFTWLSAIFPFERQRWIVAFLRNPILPFKLLRRGEERRIKDCIRRLFQSWCNKDLEKYLACWADDCVRVMGSVSTVKEDKNTIAQKFIRSCKRYSEISTPVIAFENIRISPDSRNAIAEVYYRFELIRAEDSLPAVESSREFYSLRKSGDEWLIASNIDYFTDVGKIQ